MHQNRDLHGLQQLVERLDQLAHEEERVSLAAVLNVVARRSFGPLILVAGLITLAPIVGDIPGVPSMVGILVWVVSIQLLLRREQVWLPGWLLRRSLSSSKVIKALGWCRRPARYIDRWLSPRLAVLVEGPVMYVIIAVSMIIAAAMPLMEVVPFSANFAGAALTAFGLALIARDGLLALVAIAFTGITTAFIVIPLL